MLNKYRGGDNVYRSRIDHIAYLRDCARAWRVTHGSAEQADKVDAIADRLDTSPTNNFMGGDQDWTL